jgi:hypothetical protein
MKKKRIRSDSLAMAAALVLVWACGCQTGGPPHSSLPTRDAETPAEEAVVIAGYVLYTLSGFRCY